MFYLYLFAAISGGLLVVVSLASAGHHDGSGGDGSADALTAGDSESGALVHSHDGAGHDALTAGHGDAHGDAHGHDAAGSALGVLGTLAGWVFSIQLWTYLLAFGGLTGLLLRTLAHVGEPLAGLLALGVGLGTALSARAILRRAITEGDGGMVTTQRLVGTTAKVLIPAPAGATGKIRLEARGQTIDLLAKAPDGSVLAEGAEVLILDMRDGVAEVTRDLEISLPRPRAPRQALPAGSKSPSTPSKG